MMIAKTIIIIITLTPYQDLANKMNSTAVHSRQKCSLTITWKKKKKWIWLLKHHGQVRFWLWYTYLFISLLIYIPIYLFYFFLLSFLSFSLENYDPIHKNENDTNNNVKNTKDIILMPITIVFTQSSSLSTIKAKKRNYKNKNNENNNNHQNPMKKKTITKSSTSNTPLNDTNNKMTTKTTTATHKIPQNRSILARLPQTCPNTSRTSHAIERTHSDNSSVTLLPSWFIFVCMFVHF